MKKILISVVTITLFIFATFRIANIINRSDQQTIPGTIYTYIEPTEEFVELSNKFINPLNNLETTLTIKGHTISEGLNHETGEQKWTITDGLSTLEVNLITTENYPFSSDSEPQTHTIKTKLTENIVYRIKVDDKSYFYSDSYFREDCGQEYCSNGTLELSDARFSVFCYVTENTNMERVTVCDQLVLGFES